MHEYELDAQTLDTNTHSLSLNAFVERQPCCLLAFPDLLSPLAPHLLILASQICPHLRMKTVYFDNNTRADRSNSFCLWLLCFSWYFCKSLSNARLRAVTIYY